ncbi:MAG TPA: PhnD/SsuA/transferrin family substrate-binding protein [Pirellulales bacterium]
MNAASGSDRSGRPYDPHHSGRAKSFLPRTILYACLLGAVAVAAFGVFSVGKERAAARASQDRLVAYHGLTPTTQKRLAPEFTDQDGGRLADPPSDPKLLLDPETLILAHYTDADADTQLVDWEAFQAHLAKATGKKIVGQEYLNSADDVAAIKAGEIHIVALHAADAPYVVNNVGFVPFAVLGTEDGAHGNHLVIAVSAKSQIKTLDDVRGHSLTCTVPESITGYRAAIVVLAEKTGMRPDVDYFISFSHGQKRSVFGLANGEYEVAALSDDKLQSKLKKGSVEAADVRVIYESEVIPRLTIGYVYNLNPELAAVVKGAALDFANDGGAEDESTGRPMRFTTSDYQKDFEFVRQIDDSFDPRFYKRPKTVPPPAPAVVPEALDAQPAAK